MGNDIAVKSCQTKWPNLVNNKKYRRVKRREGGKQIDYGRKLGNRVGLGRKTKC